MISALMCVVKELVFAKSGSNWLVGSRAGSQKVLLQSDWVVKSSKTGELVSEKMQFLIKVED